MKLEPVKEGESRRTYSDQDASLSQSDLPSRRELVKGLAAGIGTGTGLSLAGLPIYLSEMDKQFNDNAEVFDPATPAVRQQVKIAGSVTRTGRKYRTCPTGHSVGPSAAIIDALDQAPRSVIYYEVQVSNTPTKIEIRCDPESPACSYLDKMSSGAPVIIHGTVKMDRATKELNVYRPRVLGTPSRQPLSGSMIN